MAKGYNEIIELSNTIYRFPVNKATVMVYNYPASVVDGTIIGTPAISSDGTQIVGTLLSDNVGRYILENIKVGKYSVVVSGVGITPQVLLGYEELDISYGSDVTGTDIPYMDNTNVSIATKIQELENRLSVLE